MDKLPQEQNLSSDFPTTGNTPTPPSIGGDTLTLLKPRGAATKTWEPGGIIRKHKGGYWFTPEAHIVTDFQELETLLLELYDDPSVFLIRGTPKPNWEILIEGAQLKENAPTRRDGEILRRKDYLDDDPQHWWVLDIDGVGLLPGESFEAAVRRTVKTFPEEIQSSRYIALPSSSFGHPTAQGILKAHLYFWSPVPLTCDELKAYWSQHNSQLGDKEFAVDLSLFQTHQPCYTAKAINKDPELQDTSTNPFTADGVDVVLTIPERSVKALPEGNYSGSGGLTSTTEALHLLSFISPDCTREEWIRIGFAIHHEFEGDTAGFNVFDDWSQGSDAKYDDTKTREFWHSCRLDKAGAVTWGTVVDAAKANGYTKKDRKEEWVNEQMGNVKDSVHPLLNFRPFSMGFRNAPTFVLDNMITTGIAIIAGAPGVGKTTQLVPLACCVAHQRDWEIRAEKGTKEYEDEFNNKSLLKPRIKRRVIYVSEHPEQVEDILSGMHKKGWFGNPEDFNLEEFTDFFKIVSAARLAAGDIVSVAGKLSELYHDNYNEETGITYKAAPLLVFDTLSATVDLENENDNSEVSKTLAKIKQQLPGINFWLVSHTSKANKRGDLSGISSRGASSFEGDVFQVLYMVREDNPALINDRWLDIEHGKHRFSTHISGISFKGESAEGMAYTELGELTQVTWRFGNPTPLTREEKADLKEIATSEFEEKKIEEAKKKIVQVLSLEEKPLSGRKLYKKVRGGKGEFESALEILVDEGAVSTSTGYNKRGVNHSLSSESEKWERYQ